MREIRRKDRAIPENEAVALLERGEYGVLATAGADGTPLATPLSYVLLDGHIYFHCAMKGHKLDNLLANSRVSFSVVAGVRAVYDGSFSTYYESALAQGRAALVADEEEMRRALVALCQKYLPGFMDKAEGDIGASISRTAVVRIDVQQLTGKAKRPKPADE